MSSRQLLTCLVSFTLIVLFPDVLKSQSKHPNLFDDDFIVTTPENEKRPILDQPKFNAQAPTRYDENGQPVLTPKQKHCMALEKQLAQNWIAKSGRQEHLPRLMQELRKWDLEYNRAEQQAENRDCFNQLLFFGREFKKTRRCQRLKKRINKAKAKLDQLKRQRSAMTSNDNSQEDFLISELARYQCGEHYEKEDKRRNPSLFSFGDDDEPAPGQKGNGPHMPFATYRTMCVRTCDGFYYPVSYSTLPSRFPLDEAACQSKCAAPAKLFVYRNPGQQLEQMTSLKGELYTSTPYAFLYRKKYIEGCSCKASEFLPKKLGLDMEKIKAEKNLSTRR